MSVEQYELLKDTMDEIVTVAAKYNPHLQPAVLECLSMALIADSSGANGQLNPALQEEQGANGETVTDSAEVEDWDFRSELLQIKEQHGLSRKQFKDTEFPALLAWVVKRYAPNEHKTQPITKEHLVDGCRTVDREIPSNPANTLSKAKVSGLLDKVKGRAGYTLTPKGENLVNARIKVQDKS